MPKNHVIFNSIFNFQQFLTAIIQIGVLAHVVLAGQRLTKRRILDFNDPFSNGSSNWANNTSQGNETNCKPLNDTQAQEKIVALGVLENPGVTLVNVSGSLLSNLQANGTVTFVFQKRKKRDLTKQLCPEEDIRLYTLANKKGNLAYRITGVRCVKGNNVNSLPQCSIKFGGSSLAIGQCAKTVTTIVLQVISKCGDQFYKTIDIDCSCKCNKYSSF